MTNGYLFTSIAVFFLILYYALLAFVGDNGLSFASKTKAYSIFVISDTFLTENFPPCQCQTEDMRFFVIITGH